MNKLPTHLHPVSMDLAWNDPQKNITSIEQLLSHKLRQFPGVKSQEQLFILPELTLTAFVTNNPSSFSMDPPSAEIKKLSQIALNLNTGFVAGFPERNPFDSKKPYNTAVLIGSNGKITGFYRKMHLFTVGQNPEAETYSPGQSGSLINYRGWNIGLGICFDLRFPQLFIEYGRLGADAIVVPACWIDGPCKGEQFRSLSQAHAILAQAYVVSVNRSGQDPNFKFDGSIHMFNPLGKNLTTQIPLALEETPLQSSRALSVRAADQSAYPVKRFLP